MARLLILLVFYSTLFGFTKGNNSFLEPKKAFVTQIKNNPNSVDFNIKLDKTIYLYDNKIKVTLNGIDITKKVFNKKPVEYNGSFVHFNQLNISVKKSLIKDIVRSDNYEIIFNFQGCSKAGICYMPMEKIFKGTLYNSATKKELKVQNKPKNETDAIANRLKDGNILLILATFFGFGLLLSFTPCIFPMIPILSSIIVQHSKQQGGKISTKEGLFLSIVYILAMSLAYTIAGVLAGLFGANIQAILQEPIIIVIFATIFIILAFSMFGFYEIGLPASWQSKLNKTSKQGGKKGGIIGVAIMGFISALIVGPCVAPPLAGALIYIGQTGDAILGGAALFIMSLGMGAPLLLVGMGAGKYMPKPGGWMESVSRIFGIIMLLLALYMLDRIIDPSIMIYLWSIILIGAGLYIFEFKHIISKTIALIILLYGIIIFVGAISGALNPLKPLEKFTNTNISTKTQPLKFKKIKTIAELEDIIKTSNKPIMLDFWAKWCVSCKELDNFTFKDPKVIQELSKYTLLKADVTKNDAEDKKLMEKFNIFGPPALIFWDADGKIDDSKKIIGYKPPKEFLEIITK